MNTKKYGSMDSNLSNPPTAGGFTEIEFIIKPCAEFIMFPRTMIEIIQFSRFYSNQFSLPQTHDPTAPGYIVAKRSDGGFVSTIIRRLPDVLHRHGAAYHIIQLTLGDEPLEKEGFIQVLYGYKGAGGPGTKCPPLAKSYSFPVFISQRHVLGGQRFMEDRLISFDSLFVKHRNVSTNLVKDSAAFNPSITITGGKPEKLKIIASPRNDSQVMITANILDIHGNLSPAGNGTVVINDTGDIIVKEGFGRGFFNTQGEGVIRLSGICAELNVSGVSNPFKPGQRLSWGEIHSHSGISDGLGTDQENYLSAIQSGLDFGALSDHDTLMEKSEDRWEITVKNAEKYCNEPEFATLLGYEALAYTGSEIAGHINIYYQGDNGPMAGRPQLHDIADLCKENGALAIPHHTMYGGPFFDQMGLKMELMEPGEFDTAIMPVCEIYSTHGCSERMGCERSVLGVKDERSVNAALLKGFKWGFIGGSDNHESLLGHNFRVDRVPRTINNEHMQFRHGKTAAYVDEFSRNGVFKALKNRSVYATTGERILLDINVNGAPMGSEAESIGAEVSLTATISGTAPIEKIEIVKNGDIIHSRHPGVLDCEILFVDESRVETGTYYYIKAVQTDGEMAWSSPVWIE